MAELAFEPTPLAPARLTLIAMLGLKKSGVGVERNEEGAVMGNKALGALESDIREGLSKG